MIKIILIFWPFLFIFNFRSVLNLYPRESLTREVKTLDGIWNFRLSPDDNQEIGFKNQWYKRPLKETGKVMPMPVPSSFNDIGQEKNLRDFVGWAWYDTQFYLPMSWSNTTNRILLRFSSVHYHAICYINGINITEHVGGHLPFEVDVTQSVDFKNPNLLTVAVNNTLTLETLPQGVVKYYKNSNYVFKPNFDFFNYAGIHRSVHLFRVPSSYIYDVTLIPSYVESYGMFEYSIIFKAYGDTKSSFQCKLEIWNQLNIKKVAESSGCEGNVKIPNVQLWWPYLMHPNPGYLYNIRVKLMDKKTLTDEYHLKSGIRTIKLTSNAFLINDKPFYFLGFGKHEDSNIRGRGLDLPLLIKDFNLIKWIRANSFRTSHYPYSEELMDQADEQGIVIINECSAVGLSSFSSVILDQHKQSLYELIQRDKNRPSVVMWSIANEPHSEKNESMCYFQKIIEFVKSLEVIRPITAAINRPLNNEFLASKIDVIMINRYFGWYSDTGITNTITQNLINEFDEWYKKHGKLMIMSEYGADTVAGLHQDPSFVFTEDYQTELMMNHFDAFDQLQKKGFFIGELIWNFADFMTNQELTRVLGNRKGIFTRSRQPKASAKLLRCRYTQKNKINGDKNMYCPAV